MTWIEFVSAVNRELAVNSDKLTNGDIKIGWIDVNYKIDQDALYIEIRDGELRIDSTPF